MRARILQLKEARAIPIPQQLLDACHLENEVEVEAQDGALVIRSASSPRTGWEDAFRQMASGQSDKLPLGYAFDSKWDREEWEW